MRGEACRSRVLDGQCDLRSLAANYDDLEVAVNLLAQICYNVTA